MSVMDNERGGCAVRQLCGDLVQESSERRDSLNEDLKGTLEAGIFNRRTVQISFIATCFIHTLAYFATVFIHIY